MKLFRLKFCKVHRDHAPAFAVMYKGVRNA